MEILEKQYIMEQTYQILLLHNTINKTLHNFNWGKYRQKIIDSVDFLSSTEPTDLEIKKRFEFHHPLTLVFDIFNYFIEIINQIYELNNINLNPTYKNLSYSKPKIISNSLQIVNFIKTLPDTFNLSFLDSFVKTIEKLYFPELKYDYIYNSHASLINVKLNVIYNFTDEQLNKFKNNNITCINIINKLKIVDQIIHRFCILTNFLPPLKTSINEQEIYIINEDFSKSKFSKDFTIMLNYFFEHFNIYSDPDKNMIITENINDLFYILNYIINNLNNIFRPNYSSFHSIPNTYLSNFIDIHVLFTHSSKTEPLIDFVLNYRPDIFESVPISGGAFNYFNKYKKYKSKYYKLKSMN